MAGHFAAEHGVALAHRLLDEGMADAVHDRRAAHARDDVAYGVAGAQVVHDLRARVLQKECLGQQGRDEVARHELAGAVDEEAAIGVAVPRDADVGFLADNAFDDVRAVFFDQRVGFVVRKAPVDLHAHRDDLAGQFGEQPRRHQPAHAVAGIEHALERLDRRACR